MPTVSRKGIRRINVPSGLRTPKKPPRLEEKARSLKENISLPISDPALGWKILSVWKVWKAMRKPRTDWAQCYWAPRSLWSK
jgi:hypothetical protein